MYYSQDGQDEFLETQVFKGYRNGYFVDIGAHDGISFNNTLFFEKERNWTGINVEPIKSVFQKLVNNRPTCTNLNLAVSNKNGRAEFIRNIGYSEMISGLKDQFDPRHIERLTRELSQMGGTTNTIIVQTRKLDTICSNYNIKHINYLSIDVEGAEFDVIQSINFENVYIDVIGFENNYQDTADKIVEYLKTKDYIIIRSPSNLDIFMIHSRSHFLQNCFPLV